MRQIGANPWLYKSRTRKVAHVNLLKSKPCYRCNISLPSWAMTFHHRDRLSKVVDISRAVREMGWERLLSELEKCEVACPNCHSLSHTPKSLYAERIVPRTSKQRYRHKRRDQIRKYLLSIRSVPCASCHDELPPHCMRFYHRDPLYKTMEIAAIQSRHWSTSWAKIRAEVQKCDVLCPNCAALKHPPNDRRFLL